MSETGIMSQQQANEIYSILVAEGGASENMRQSFELEYTQVARPSREWRFSGHLGFGGKFRIGERDGKVRYYVDCYPEDNNETRQQVIDGINSKLAVFG